MKKKETRFKVILKEKPAGIFEVALLVDTETGVEYLLASPMVSGSGLAAIIDENGRPIINEEYRRK
jgi:hypothetical protein